MLENTLLLQSKISNCKNATRIVVKIGTNVLMGSEGKTTRIPDESIITEIVQQIVTLKKKGKEIILVSSGAIGFGAEELRVEKPVVDIPVRQACAAVGQPILMQTYKKIFYELNTHCAQLLLTGSDFSSHANNVALHNCIEVLLSSGVIPIINENDSVSIDEIGITFGDNDNLSATVASKINAQLLILLTDVDALYDKNPKKNKDAVRIAEIRDIAPFIVEHRQKVETGSVVGTGGMYTKLQAARTAKEANCTTIIALATRPRVLLEIMEGKNPGTIFL